MGRSGLRKSIDPFSCLDCRVDKLAQKLLRLTWPSNSIPKYHFISSKWNAMVGDVGVDGQSWWRIKNVYMYTFHPSKMCKCGLLCSANKHDLQTWVVRQSMQRNFSASGCKHKEQLSPDGQYDSICACTICGINLVHFSILFSFVWL